MTKERPAFFRWMAAQIPANPAPMMATSIISGILLATGSEEHLASLRSARRSWMKTPPIIAEIGEDEAAQRSRLDEQEMQQRRPLARRPENAVGVHEAELLL